ncbi:hypothetical protein COV24_01900 [candidate division WWE3 bacterium CG10_big_fil_rev_8_21_14_0_10_32_10]|uniref:Gcp-like domain-containing protein n=1 Tax=candidate division WWE3 bacterium CG10_big_fil_rev_8_21_14_0_10_32_10 TaxID=1975090 RepID=A0A2H0RCK9_UNCKA|nr:MAG: hypothetical protein COV24_01900 [candidate division WWE3 bacterium CG10_big_fil_rev_8_21_14_0_10_32_10]
MSDKKYILYIESKGKNEKRVGILKDDIPCEMLKVKGDVFEFVKELLKNTNLTLNDFDDFIAVPTESFTGLRQATNICNILKHYVNSVPISDLKYPKYHKEPNITLSKK